MGTWMTRQEHEEQTQKLHERVRELERARTSALDAVYSATQDNFRMRAEHTRMLSEMARMEGRVAHVKRAQELLNEAEKRIAIQQLSMYGLAGACAVLMVLVACAWMA